MSAKDPHEVLAGLVARNSATVLSLPSGGMLRNHRTRFLASAPEGTWIESVPSDNSLIDSLIAANTPVGVTCKVGVESLRFVAPILQRRSDFPLAKGDKVEAVLVKRPDNIILQQRRNDYRVRITADDPLIAHAWQIPEHAYLNDKPSARAQLKLVVRDLSAGGIGLTITGRGNGDGPRATLGERVRLELQADSQTILLDGRVVFAKASADGSEIQCGIHFQHLERDIEGRQKLAQLTRIIGHLQREEVRRARLARSA
jgi:hypothetical protein